MVKDFMSKKEDNSPLFELTKYLGVGWKPVHIRTERIKEGANMLKQEITLSYVRIKKPPEGEEHLKKKSNLQIIVFNE